MLDPAVAHLWATCDLCSGGPALTPVLLTVPLQLSPSTLRLQGQQLSQGQQLDRTCLRRLLLPANASQHFTRGLCVRLASQERELAAWCSL